MDLRHWREWVCSLKIGMLMLIELEIPRSTPTTTINNSLSVDISRDHRTI